MKEFSLVNLTSHDIVVRSESGDDCIIPASGAVARIDMSHRKHALSKELPKIGFRVCETAYGEVTGLPPSREGVFYITSFPVMQAVASRGRRDVVSPDTTSPDVVKSPDGKIVAVRGFQIWAS